MLALLIGSVAPALAQGFFDKECPNCQGNGRVTVTCDLCNGVKTISHTLTYQVLDYYEEKINAVDGVYFKIHIKLKNTDNYNGQFTIKETVNIGGHISYQTVSTYLSSHELKEIIFPKEGTYPPYDMYYAGFSTYSHEYIVTPSQVSVTCPKCNGTGTITVTCPVCNGSGYVIDLTKIWLAAGFVAVTTIVISVGAFVLIKRKKAMHREKR